MIHIALLFQIHIVFSILDILVNSLKVEKQIAMGKSKNIKKTKKGIIQRE
jgi:hypothetical protein